VKPNGRSPKATAAPAGRLFFPQSQSLGIDQTDVSSAVQQKVVYAGTVARSFAEASDLLQRLADLPVVSKSVERLTRRIGAERVAERDAHTAAFTALPLPEKFMVPPETVAPDVAVVMVDGGRMQILERRAAAVPAVPEAAAGTDEAWPEDDRAAAGHWREDKVGLLVTMQSPVAADDPCPQIPPAFLDATRIPRLVRELKKTAAETADAVADSAEPEVANAALTEEPTYVPPTVQQRQVRASRATWPVFAETVAAAAWAAGFQGAPRKAFVADGAASNWKVQRRFFASFVPILDFIHALSYIFAAALAGRKFAEGWAVYRQWIQWVGQGDVAQVIEALAERQAAVRTPLADEPETSPRKIVARTLTYLRNHQDKMG